MKYINSHVLATAAIVWVLVLVLTGCYVIHRYDHTYRHEDTALSMDTEQIATTPAQAQAVVVTTPDVYVSYWKPSDATYQSMGWLVIDADEHLYWHGCKTSFLAHQTPPQPSIVLELPANNDCSLNDAARTRIKFVHLEKPSKTCELIVSAYASESDLIEHRPAASGLYTRALCQ